jgi:YVTN family beta-propeller protein
LRNKWVLAIIALFVLSSFTLSVSAASGGLLNPTPLHAAIQPAIPQSVPMPLSKVRALGHITQDDKPIPVGISDPSNNYLYVADSNENNVTVINASDNKVLTSISVGREPVQIVNDSANAREWVTNFGSNTVSVVDTATNEVEATIPVGTNPYGLVFDTANGFVYVADYGSNSVTVINSTTLEVNTTITSSGLDGPLNLAFSPLKGYVYVTNSGSDTVSVLSGTEIIGTVDVAQNPTGIAYDLADRDVYTCINSDSDVVLFKGTQTSGTFFAKVAVGQGPLGIGYDAKNHFMYVASYRGNSVTVIKGKKSEGSVTVNMPRYLVYDSDNTYVYVTNSTNTITYLSSGK